MDPNETLRQLRISIQEFQENGTLKDEESVQVTMTHLEALDEWLSKGGFLPDVWLPKTDWEAKARGMVKRL